jgi:hypothetical protein
LLIVVYDKEEGKTQQLNRREQTEKEKARKTAQIMRVTLAVILWHLQCQLRRGQATQRIHAIHHSHHALHHH